MASTVVGISKRFGIFFLICIFLIFLMSSNKKNTTSPLQLPYQDISNEYTTTNDGDQVQAIRRSKIIETCMQYAGQAVIKPMNPYFTTKFWPASLTLDEDEGLGWCRIGKVATAPWSALFLLLRSVPLDKIRVALSPHNKVTPHELLKKTHTSKPNERIHMVRGEHGKEYFTFLVVRHPFVRLVSAYRDKLQNLTE